MSKLFDFVISYLSLSLAIYFSLEEGLEAWLIMLLYLTSLSFFTSLLFTFLNEIKDEIIKLIAKKD